MYLGEMKQRREIFVHLFHMLEKFMKCSKDLVKVTRLGLTLKINIFRQLFNYHTN